MNARAFLVRGLLAGLLAGLATFAVAHAVGEPHVEAAIALESAGAATPADPSAHGSDGHSHSHSSEQPGSDETVVSRSTQRTWGLLTGSLVIGIALGGLVALVAAATLGRVGRLSPGQSTALVALVGFVSVALVPFLKYPANPPAVGSGETIGDRTALFFGFLVVSVAAAALSTYGAARLRTRLGTYAAVVAGIGGYLLVVVVAASVFAPINELGDFPADTLWSFRLASLLTLATMWGVLSIALTGLVTRLVAQETAVVERRELAASI